MAFRTCRQHVARDSRAVASRKAAVLALIGVSAVFFNATPSTFFAGAPVATASAAEVQDKTAEKPERSFEFYKKPRFLKLLLTNPEIKKLGGPAQMKAMAEKANTEMKLSIAGDYFPFKSFPLKPIIFSGEAHDLLAVFRELSKKGEGDDVNFSFLVPRTARGALIGTSGQNIMDVRQKTSATVMLQDEESQRSSETEVFVSGKVANVEGVVEWLLAQQESYIDDMREILYTNYHQPSKAGLKAEIVIFLTDSQAARVMGKGGSTIQKLRDIYLVDISFDRSNQGPNGETIANISGRIGDVHKLHEYLLTSFMQPAPSTNK